MFDFRGMDVPYSMLVVLALMAALIFSMVVITVSIKSLRAARERWYRANQEILEPALEEFMATGEPRPELQRRGVRRLDRFLAPMMVERMSYLRGSGKDRMAALARELGLVDKHLLDLGSRSRWKRSRAAERLGYFGGASEVAALGKLLSDEDETVRAVAARSLARLATPEAVELLVSTLDGPSELTRLRVAENLDRVGRLAEPYLIALLEEAADPERESAPYGPILASRVLGGLRSYGARPALRKAAAGGATPDIRAQATRALGRIGDPDDVPLLLDRASDEQWPVRTQAANALGYIGDAAAIPVLKGLVSNQAWWVRVAAGRALVNMGTAGEDALIELLASDDEYGRRRAAAALEARGVTRRLVRELTREDARGVRARGAIPAIVRTGASRYLKDLSGDLPQAERYALEKILSGAPESEAPRLESPARVET